MRPLLIFFFFITFQNPGFCQEDAFRKNTISVESGIWSRGLAGLSYSRKFLKTEFLFISADAFAGVGSSGFYLGAGAALNLGREEFFFSIGVDVKHCGVEYSENSLFKEYTFLGLAYNPYLGLNLFTRSGLSVKVRGGFMPIYKNRAYDGSFPTAGISLGYSF